jgi:hypothetical protein
MPEQHEVHGGQPRDVEAEVSSLGHLKNEGHDIAVAFDFLPGCGIRIEGRLPFDRSDGILLAHDEAFDRVRGLDGSRLGGSPEGARPSPGCSQILREALAQCVDLDNDIPVSRMKVRRAEEFSLTHVSERY